MRSVISIPGHLALIDWNPYTRLMVIRRGVAPPKRTAYPALYEKFNLEISDVIYN